MRNFLESPFTLLPLFFFFAVLKIKIIETIKIQLQCYYEQLFKFSEVIVTILSMFNAAAVWAIDCTQDVNWDLYC